MPPIIMTPEKADMLGTRDLSAQIIQSLTYQENSDLIAIGSSIPRVISAINVSRSIANVNIINVSLNIISIPIYGNQDAVHIELSRNEVEKASIIDEFEVSLKRNREDQVVWVSRRDDLSSITNLILYRLNKYDQVKVIASGFAITTAVTAVLQVSHSGISRDPIKISAVVLDSVKGRGDTAKFSPSIEIYLEKGKLTEYSANHIKLIEDLLKED